MTKFFSFQECSHQFFFMAVSSSDMLVFTMMMFCHGFS